MTKIDARDRDSVQLVTDLVSKVSAVLERRDARAQSVFKGTDYEDTALLGVARIAEGNGDTFERVGNTPGLRGKKGDGLITVRVPKLDSPVRVAIEAKSQKDIRLDALLSELDQAMANRDAASAIAVVPSTLVRASSGSRLQRRGNKFVCAFDPENEDLLPLEVAYSLARLEACQRLSATSEDTDMETIVILADRAISQLQQLTRVERELGAGRKSLEDAHSIVVDLRTELRTTLIELRSVAIQQ